MAALTIINPYKMNNKWLLLVLGLALTIYGGWKIYLYFTGGTARTLDIILGIAFLVMGVFDLNKFYKIYKTEKS